MIRRLIVLLLFALPLTTMAQVDDAIEQWVEEHGSTASASELSDLLLQLSDNPVNLNDTVAVASLPFLSPFQVKALRNYITLYGQLLSLKELPMVPGFDSLTIAVTKSQKEDIFYISLNAQGCVTRHLVKNIRYPVIPRLGDRLARIRVDDRLGIKRIVVLEIPFRQLIHSKKESEGCILGLI